ncbi:MAG: transcriptional regulator [Deltaproteobacteria bacterium]|nr:transcriptional regulator [Deltaproteobacteria bacterium]
MMELKELEIGLERDIFLRSLIRELSGVLEDVVGVKEASGFVSVVGQSIGDWINVEYRKALRVSNLSREQVAQVCVDLKRRIQGKFSIIEENEDVIVFGNTACPFGDKVIGRESMCMMTSNVFGHIAAQNLGYARVELQETIAKGNSGCRIVLYLQPLPEPSGGREYFRADLNNK